MTTHQKPIKARRSRVTLKHVAEHAGVSTATVSDIINRGRASNYTESTTTRVRESIETLGYRATKAAQQLRRGSCDTVGVVLTRSFDNPYYARLFDALQKAIRQFDLTPEFILLDEHTLTDVNRVCDSLISQGVEAIVLGPVYYSDEILLDSLRQQRLESTPLLTFGSVEDGLGSEHVVLGDHVAGELVVDYLVSKGHNRLAYLEAYPEKHSKLGLGQNSFQQGIEIALRKRKLADKSQLVRRSLSVAGATELSTVSTFAMHWLAADPATRPTAVICVNDHLAIRALSIFHSHGINVPCDLSVIGYDNIPESAFTIPPLSTVDNAMNYRIEIIAQKTASLVVQARSVDKPPFAKRKKLEPIIVERDTVIMRPALDP